MQNRVRVRSRMQKETKHKDIERLHRRRQVCGEVWPLGNRDSVMEKEGNL